MWHIKVGETFIETTEGHSFWVVGYGFKYSHDLEVGDHVITVEGIEAEITFVEKVEIEPTKTYNFEVEDGHTYFVSDAEVWVHNSSGKCDDVVEEAAEALGKGGSGVRNRIGNPVKPMEKI
ncbi:MAG: HINT domain-containing protein [Lachnospiraceae bacterium]|nr:HINT domain-containing protein [Lachnospiraceae bacterium]